MKRQLHSYNSSGSKKNKKTPSKSVCEVCERVKTENYPIWHLGPKNAWEDTAASGWTVHNSKRGISAINIKLRFTKVSHPYFSYMSTSVLNDDLIDKSMVAARCQFALQQKKTHANTSKFRKRWHSLARLTFTTVTIISFIFFYKIWTVKWTTVTPSGHHKKGNKSLLG